MPTDKSQIPPGNRKWACNNCGRLYHWPAQASLCRIRVCKGVSNLLDDVYRTLKEALPRTVGPDYTMGAAKAVVQMLEKRNASQ